MDKYKITESNTMGFILNSTYTERVNYVADKMGADHYATIAHAIDRLYMYYALQEKALNER